MKELHEENVPDPPVLQVPDIAPIGPPAPAPPEGKDREEDPYFTIEEEDLDEEEEHDQHAVSSSFVAPFQSSLPLYLKATKQQGSPNQEGGSSSSAPVKEKHQTQVRIMPSWMRITVLVIVILLALGFLWFNVFAQSTPPLAIQDPIATTVPTHVAITPPIVKMIPTPVVGGASPLMGQDWVPQQLPAGWANAGLTIGDGIYAERTAWAFTDREESLDFRNVGTRTHHAGTFTAATFILTPGGKFRFQQNDVRVVNNVLFDGVTDPTRQLVQAAVNGVPHLLSFQVQGQNEFAWVDVSFQMYQSQLDPNDPQHLHRIEGIQMDPTTGQPRIHHMNVLLVRVTPGTQGQGAPMGGSGWLVSNYGLDMPNNALVETLLPV